MPVFDPKSYRRAYYATPRSERKAFAAAFRTEHRKAIKDYRAAHPLKPAAQQVMKPRHRSREVLTVGLIIRLPALLHTMGSRYANA